MHEKVCLTSYNGTAAIVVPPEVTIEVFTLDETSGFSEDVEKNPAAPSVAGENVVIGLSTGCDQPCASSLAGPEGCNGLAAH